MIVAEFSMVPMGEGTSSSKYVRKVHKVLKDSGLKFVLGPMSTSVEAGSLDEIFSVIEKANQALVQMNVKRIITSVKVDYRLDKEISIDSKLNAVME
ncbi:MAG: MTH1187 family thiamine-binding protein [Methanotrichaceae archaeon]